MKSRFDVRMAFGSSAKSESLFFIRNPLALYSTSPAK